VELIAVELSRLVSLFLARRLAGQLYLPTACRAFVERYRFSAFPESVEQMAKEPMNFGHGLFGDVAIESFEIYSDGVVIVSRSPTDVLDEFLADVTNWCKSELGLDRIETHTVSRIYESHLLFRSDQEILRSLVPLADIGRLLSSGLKKVSNQDVKFEPFGVSLASDQSTVTGLRPIAFRVERKAGIEFSRNYYISSAPLRTKEHIALLKKLEASV
jgi:hypothetical protein